MAKRKKEIKVRDGRLGDNTPSVDFDDWEPTLF